MCNRASETEFGKNVANLRKIGLGQMCFFLANFFPPTVRDIDHQKRTAETSTRNRTCPTELSIKTRCPLPPPIEIQKRPDKAFSEHWFFGCSLMNVGKKWSSSWHVCIFYPSLRFRFRTRLNRDWGTRLGSQLVLALAGSVCGSRCVDHGMVMQRLKLTRVPS